jgi:hypothetical protein
MKPAAILSGLFLVGSTINITRQTAFKYEEITEGMQYAINKKITGDYLYLYHSSGPAFIYYTEIHPDKKRWATLKNADILKWDTNYETLAWEMNYAWETKGPFAFVFTNETPREFDDRQYWLQRYLKLIDKLDKKEVKCLIMAE